MSGVQTDAMLCNKFLINCILLLSTLLHVAEVGKTQSIEVQSKIPHPFPD